MNISKQQQCARLEVENSIKALASNTSSKNETGLVSYKIRVPQLRQRLKETYSFSNLEPKTRLLIWDYIWKTSSCFEAMSLCLYAYQKKEPLKKTEVTKIITWASRITCWEHSDDLSKIYAQVIEDNPDFMLTQLQKWNSSKSLWKRRQSVVSLLEYAAKRNTVLPFKTMIAQVDNLILDKEYYVQKGLGWTLREIYNVYPEKTLKYIKENLFKISPIAYSAATEKIDKKTKANLNNERRAYRLKKTGVYKY